MKKLICVILTLVMALSLAAFRGKEKASVSTDGSTSMQKVINALGESFMEDTGANFTYNATGSGTGINAVKDGTCDIGLSSRYLKDSEKAEGLQETIVAIDGIAMIVHTDNPVADLTLQQIADIFKGEVTNWSEVGGKDGEIVCIGREESSGTRDGFESMKLLLRQQPVARDLRQISAAMKMITDIARIGDQAEDIVDIIPFMIAHPNEKFPKIREMAKAAQFMVTEGVNAYVKQDLALAKKFTAHDDVIDTYFTQVKNGIIDLIAAEPSQGEYALDLLMIAKYFERIGDHCTNIAEWVEFSANVSHELKTPLQGIIGSAELLESGMVKPEDTSRFVGHIRKEAARLVNLIEDIIRLSQLDEGAELPTEWVNILQLAEEVKEILALSAADKRVTVQVTGAGFCVVGVRRMLQEIIYNLCDNAIKYNIPGGSVNIHAENDRLVVRDTGIGIPAEHKDRIFERFYRVDKSHSKASGGTGLGLSIVKHAAACHNAEISLESVPGKGTTITIQF